MTSQDDAHATTHAADGMVGPHGSMDDHGADHGHDDHAHGSGSALGPMDIRAWGYGLLGILAGLAVAVAFALGGGFIAR
ncbi:MAG TPA: hypothetical protein VF484_10840 [Candidatus Limnocylindrales bacterium]